MNDVWERKRKLDEDIGECLGGKVFKGDKGEERESMIKLVRCVMKGRRGGYDVSWSLNWK